MRVLYLKEKSRSGDRSYRGGVRRDRRHWGKLAFREKVAIGRSLLQGRCQEREAIMGGRGRRRSRHDREGEEVAIRRSILQGRDVAIGRRGRDREIAPTAFSDNYELKKQSGGVSPTALSVSSHRFIPETSLLLAGRFQIAPSRCCFTSGTDVPFETVRTCQGLAISV